MSLTPFLRAAFVTLMIGLLAVASLSTAYARVGGGSSSGSRGSFTYSPPPSTPTAPYAAQPMQRSFTPQAPAPSFAPSYAQPGIANRGLFGGAGGFGTGLLGGFLGAGLVGMMFGHGFMGGIGGGMSFFGLLIQFAIMFFAIRFIFSFFTRRTSPVGMDMGMMGSGPGMASAPSRPAIRQVDVTPEDFAAFEQRLVAIQEAYSREDLDGLRRMATPEMVAYFAEDLAHNAGHGQVNRVSQVKLLQGDLSEAWGEGAVDYATVAMRFSLIDATYERATDRVVAGDPVTPQQVTEIWTFRRDGSGPWMLSAIQQTG
jgi:predicted lipid-binding transport protein (Tim44 family)